MFEDDVTVPAGWYPDPMGLPQLRWWNNHAWTELTTEARPPLVMQVPTRLAYADEELPTRRQQREQRERDEQQSALETDEGESRDATDRRAPASVTLREIDAPVSARTVEEPPAVSTVDNSTVENSTVENTVTVDSLADASPLPSAAEPSSAEPTSEPATAPTAKAPLHDPVDDEPADDEPVDDWAHDVTGAREVFVPRTAFGTTEGSVFGTPVTAESAAEDRIRLDDGAYRREARYSDDRRGSASRLPIYTAPVWIIALVPLLLLVFSLLLLLGFGSSLNMWVTPAIWGISYLAVVILAITDRAALGRAGYEHRASWAWALLTAPVYLLARSMSLSKVGPLGFAPVLVWAALGILQIGSVLVVPGLIISALPNVFATQAEQSIASDASIIGADITVDCAKNLPVIIGQTFTCSATNAKNDPFTIAVSLQRTNGWIDWHVEDWGIYTLSR
ncbi:DUF2510 domain-containing protein [Glaciihabitans sp. INWT7]|uniref:DUF2510 domain-containing protein n=1 Tax=Glaciihabitans sp. INWT7 TaxID=2596912 RepID=UPI001626924B|nr:DUF2510 domain-containing protein [Glaciihabitans sp. INWT7]